MSKRILYNIASRERPQQLIQMLDNIWQMQEFPSMVLLKVDEDDPKLPEYLELIKLHRFDEDVEIKIGRSVSKIHAINRDIPREGWDILVNVSDDQRFTQKGFDQFIRNYMPDDLFGFLHFPDQFALSSVCTLSIIGHQYFAARRRQVYSPDYYSLFADNEETEVAKLLGAYRFSPERLFEHHHFTAGLAQRDALYSRNNTFKRDKKVYMLRKGLNYDLPFPKDPFLLIKYATRGRWRLFFDALENIYQTIRTNQFLIIVSADEDDPEMNSAEVRERLRRYPNAQIYYGPSVSKIHAINRDMPAGLHWDWCVNMSDDMQFIVPGWDKLMHEKIEAIWGDSTDFFAHFADGYVNEKLPTLNVCGREYYNRFGYIYHPDYKSVSCDAENMFVAQMIGRYHYFPAVYFNHLHPANLHEPSDYIYRRNHSFGEADTKLYFERLKRKFEVVEPVMIPEQMKPFL